MPSANRYRIIQLNDIATLLWYVGWWVCCCSLVTTTSLTENSRFTKPASVAVILGERHRRTMKHVKSVWCA